MSKHPAMKWVNDFRDFMPAEAGLFQIRPTWLLVRASEDSTCNPQEWATILLQTNGTWKALHCGRSYDSLHEAVKVCEKYAAKALRTEAVRLRECADWLKENPSVCVEEGDQELIT